VSRSRYATIGVALLLLVAGCGGAGSESATPETDAPTVDPSENATDDEATRLGNVEYPDGFSRAAVDVATARRLSVQYLRRESVSGVALERFRPGAYADYQYEANRTRARFRLDVHNGYADVTERDVYVASAVRHSRSGRNGQIAFEATNGSIKETRFRAADSMWAVVSRILTVGELRVVRVTGDADDRRIRYTITDVVVRNATDVRGHLTVDDDGVVRDARLQYTQGGEPKRFQYAVTSGTTVTPPAWLPAARVDSPEARRTAARPHATESEPRAPGRRTARGAAKRSVSPVPDDRPMAGPVRGDVPEVDDGPEYDLDFRANPARYRHTSDERGVFKIEPYKSELLPHWEVASLEGATEGAGAIVERYRAYREVNDLVGMDLARKFLQMGWTRAMRYAKYPGGEKYERTDAGERVEREPETWYDPEKREIAPGVPRTARPGARGSGVRACP